MLILYIFYIFHLVNLKLLFSRLFRYDSDLVFPVEQRYFKVAYFHVSIQINPTKMISVFRQSPGHCYFKQVLGKELNIKKWNQHS